MHARELVDMELANDAPVCRRSDSQKNFCRPPHKKTRDTKLRRESRVHDHKAMAISFVAIKSFVTEL